MAETRVTNGCADCGQVDNHPRHSVLVVDTDPRNDVQSARWIDRHVDCCAASGCDLCATKLEFVPKSKAHGLKLAAALVDRTPELDAALYERHGIATPVTEPELAALHNDNPEA